MFCEFVSNTSLALGKSYLIEKTNGVLRQRVYVKPTLYGDFAWRFYFLNSVNSTYANGEVSHAGMSGGHWTIHHAQIGISKSLSPDDEVSSVVEVTFDSKTSRSVSPDEELWSDEVRFEIREGYLVWEWEIEGEGIPSMPEDIYSAYTWNGDKWVQEWNRTQPCMMAIKREYKKRVGFLGDSITAGCGTKKDGYEMWVARIAEAVKNDFPVWNLGLGYGRGSDCATNSSWLYKAKKLDTVVITYGVNDLRSGEYGKGRGSSAGEIVRWAEIMVEELQGADIKVIIATIPPFEYSERERWEWRCANLGLRLLAQRKGCEVFDIASSLESEPFKGDFPHGSHPDGEGCRLAFEKFKESFFIDGEWKL